jgi:hypothetical protein
MGSSIPDDGGFDDLPSDEPIEAPVDDKPFDDEPFDAGVEADEENDPEKYIQQLSGKLGQSLRKYTEELGEPDFDLEKFAINSVLSATNSGEMDSKDQSDIIQKVKSSTTDGTGKKDDEELPEPDVDDDDEDLPSDEPIDLDSMEESVLEKKSTDDLLNKKVYVTNLKKSGIVKKQDGNDIVVELPNKQMVNVTIADVKEVTETFNPNANGKTVFEDPYLGVDDEGMEENKYSLLSKKIKEMVEETFMTVDATSHAPVKEPEVLPEVKPKRKSRKSKTYRVTRENTPNPNPKASS